MELYRRTRYQCDHTQQIHHNHLVTAAAAAATQTHVHNTHYYNINIIAFRCLFPSAFDLYAIF